jgi:hypothetical protein
MRRCSWKRPHHNPGASIATSLRYMSYGEVPQPPLDAIARHCVPYGTADHKADARPVRRVPVIQMHSMDDQGGPAYA